MGTYMGIYTIEGCQNKIKEIRKKQVQIQNRIEKQEENGIFDESLYNELDDLDRNIAYWESQIKYIEQYDEGLKN